MKKKFTFMILAMLFAILGPGAKAWGQTSTWDLTKSSTDWTATGNETYFSQPYGYKKANGTLTNKNVADFTTYATGGKTITSIKVGFKGLRNGTTASKITISLVDKDGNILTSGSELELTNASTANNTAYVYSTFTTGFTGATGFMMKVTTFGKNVLINGASYEIEYTEVGAPELESIAISGTPNKTTYEAGESFDPAGLVVTGTYDDESTAEITSGITWDVTPNPLTAGTTSVSVTATVDGKTATETYNVTVTAALPKITITADKIANFASSYAEYTWTANDVSGKCWAYRGGSSGSYNIQFNKTTYVYNTTAVPGRITSVKMTKVAGTTRSWSIYGADEALTGDNYTTAGTQIGSAQEVSSETGTTWNVPNDKNYTYFYITKADGGTNIGEIVISYEEDTEPSITADVEAIEFEQKELDETVTDSKVISATGKNLTAAIAASMKEGSDAVFSVVANGTPTAAAGEFTVSYSTTEAGEYAGTVVLSSGETSIEIPVSASVVAHIPVLQSIAVKTAPTKTTYFVGEKFDPTGLEITATYDAGGPKDIAYFGNEDKFSFNPALDAALATTNEKVTITYGDKTAEQAIIVKTIANTQETAYTVAEAKSLIDANPTGLDTTKVYVKGTVSKIVTEWSSQYGNITFDVSADGQTTGNQFQFYRNFKGAENEKWASEAECPAVGDDVIGIGTMKKYGSTYEFNAGNYLVSLIRVATLSIDDITVSLGGTISPEITSNVPEAERTITYSVASEDVVKVQDGKLVTVAVGGPVTVTATLTADGYKEATTTFTVEVIKALTSIEIATGPTVTDYKEGDKFNPAGLVITANYNDESTEDVAYAGNEDKFTFEPSLETPLSEGNTSVTITYAGKTTTQAITVRALYTYNITWKANGEQFATTKVTEGDALVLPTTNPDNVGDMVFQGWIAAESYYDAETAPEYIVPDEIIPTEAMTFYAVYAKEHKDIQETTSTMDFSEETYSDWEIDDKIVRTANQGTGGAGDYAGKINTNNTYITFNKKVKVESFGFSFKRTSANENYNVYIETSTDDEHWTARQTYPMKDFGNGSYTTKTDDTFDGKTDLYVRFHCYNTTATRYVDDVIIRYMGEDITYSNFCTTVELINEDKTISGNATWEGNYTINGNTVTIGSGAVLTVNGALINTDPANLIIEDGAQLIVNNSVQATVKKNIAEANTRDSKWSDWYTISSPLADDVEFTEVENLIPGNDVTNTSYDLYRLNEAAGMWENSRIEDQSQNEFTTIDKGRGYLYARKDKAQLEFKGVINVADVENVNLTMTADKGKGFNLIGNPFMQNITLDNVTGVTLAGGFYVLSNENTWRTKPTDSIIAPLQGFLVQAKTAGTATISKYAASKGERSEQNTNIEMIVSNSTYRDNAFAMFGEGIGLNKVNHRNAQAPMLYIPQDGEKFAIAFMDENTTVFPLNFKAMTTGKYSISLKATDDINTLVLVDNMTGVETNMLLEESYSFNGSPADSDGRFTVKLSISHNSGQADNEHFVYQNGKELVVNGEGTLQIFDVLGRVVISEEVHGQTVYVGNLSEGAYIVRMTGNEIKTQKIIIR